jgi:hypothetical protein
MSCTASCSSIFLATSIEYAKERVNAMVTIRPADLRQRRTRLTREPLAARLARSQVRAAVRSWAIPVDPDIAMLLTSDLVTDAITCGTGQTVTLAIRCSRAALRVDVYHASRPRPAGADEPAGTGPGLVLLAALATDWGAFRTPAGTVTYFTLGFEPDLLPHGRHGVTDVGTVSRIPRPARRPH